MEIKITINGITHEYIPGDANPEHCGYCSFGALGNALCFRYSDQSLCDVMGIIKYWERVRGHFEITQNV